MDQQFELMEDVMEEDNKSFPGSPNDGSSSRGEIFLTPYQTPKPKCVEEKPVRPILKALRRISNPLTVVSSRCDDENDYLSLRGRVVSRKRKAVDTLVGPPTKYVSLAEAIHRFQVSTPPRFHSTVKNSGPQLDNTKLKMTFPLTPVLQTRKREEMREKSTQAGELNKPGVSGESQASVSGTEAPSSSKKSKDNSVLPFNFKARPLPKSIYSTARPVRVAADKKENSYMDLSLNVVERGQEMLKKREALIKKVLEEEKKQRGFSATPLPQFFTSKCQSLNLTINSSHSCLESWVHSQFKAREAAVLKKEPFKPKKSERSATEHKEFQLSSERRAKDREVFNEKIKEKEELLALRKIEDEEAEKEAIAKEEAMLRKITVHKATPLPAYLRRLKDKHS